MERAELANLAESIIEKQEAAVQRLTEAAKRQGVASHHIDKVCNWSIIIIIIIFFKYIFGFSNIYLGSAT